MHAKEISAFRDPTSGKVLRHSIILGCRHALDQSSLQQSRQTDGTYICPIDNTITKITRCASFFEEKGVLPTAKLS